jgi:hypothetical protein
MAKLLDVPPDGSGIHRSRPRTRLWLTASLISVGITLAQLFGAVLPSISQDFRDSGSASFVPIFIVVALLLATLVGLVFGTAWWLGLLGSAKIRRRGKTNIPLVSALTVATVAVVAGGISGAIAPLLYTDFPLNSPWFDSISVALITGVATFWLLRKSEVFRLD